MNDFSDNSVAILLPVFNAEKTILRTIRSIVRQTHTDWTLYIINDGSTDNTLEIIESFFDQRIKLINLPDNIGLSSALNRGMSEISERYVFRIDADDEMLPNRIVNQLDMVDPSDHVGVYCGALRLNGIKLHKPMFRSNKQLRQLLCFANPIAHPTVMFDQKYCTGIVYKDVKCEDYLLWCNLSANGVRFKATPTPLINYYLSKEQKSVVEEVDIPPLAAKIACEYTLETHPKLATPLNKIGYTFKLDTKVQNLIEILLKSLIFGLFDDWKVEKLFQKRLIVRILKKWI